MSDVPSDTLSTFRRKPVPTGGGAVKMRPLSTLVCVTRNRPSNCPHRFSSNCLSPFMFATETVSLVGTTAALPNYGAGRPNSAIPMNGFADRIECSGPTAVCSRTINARWPMCCVPAFPCVTRKSTLSDQMVRAASRSLPSRQSRTKRETLSAPSTASRM